MKIFTLKIAKCDNPILWYYDKVGEEIYATSVGCGLFRDIEKGKYRLISKRNPIDVNGYYIQIQDAEIIEEFEGNIVAEVSIERVA